MFSFSSMLFFQTEALAAIHQSRIELMRALFPQVLPWRLARIQGAMVELTRLPAVFSKTFSDSLDGEPEPAQLVATKAGAAEAPGAAPQKANVPARKPAGRRKTKAPSAP